MLSDEIIDGGSRVDDAVFATEFAKAGMDFISLCAEESLMMPNSPRWGGPLIPIPEEVATNACRNIYLISRGPTNATLNPQR